MDHNTFVQLDYVLAENKAVARYDKHIPSLVRVQIERICCWVVRKKVTRESLDVVQEEGAILVAQAVNPTGDSGGSRFNCDVTKHWADASSCSPTVEKIAVGNTDKLMIA